MPLSHIDLACVCECECNEVLKTLLSVCYQLPMGRGGALLHMTSRSSA